MCVCVCVSLILIPHMTHENLSGLWSTSPLLISMPADRQEDWIGVGDVEASLTTLGRLSGDQAQLSAPQNLERSSFCQFYNCMVFGGFLVV